MGEENEKDKKTKEKEKKQTYSHHDHMCPISHAHVSRLHKVSNKVSNDQNILPEAKKKIRIQS
jgi:hypothetical protein